MEKSFTIPWPDFPFHRHSDKRVTPEDRERFRCLVCESTKEIVKSNEWVALTLRFYPKGEGDIDNLVKPMLDALKGHAYDDDKQVVELHAYLIRESTRPRIEIKFEKLERFLNYFADELAQSGITPEDLQRRLGRPSG